MTGFVTRALLLLVIAIVNLPVLAQSRPTETTICAISNQPFKYIGKRVRVHVQEGVDRLGFPVLAEPLKPDFTVRVLPFDNGCVVGFEYNGQVPKDWIIGMGLAIGGPILRQFPIAVYGGQATVVATVRYARNAVPVARFVRNEKGNIVLAHPWDVQPTFGPRILLVIESIDE